MVWLALLYKTTIKMVYNSQICINIIRLTSSYRIKTYYTNNNTVPAVPIDEIIIKPVIKVLWYYTSMTIMYTIIY